MKENKRVEIINAAATVFSRDGFHGAKMENIAKGANVGKGTIYGYFDSKEELFKEMIRHTMNEYKDGMEKVLKIERSIKEKMIGLFKYHGGFLNKHVDIAKVVMSEQEVLPREMKKEMIEDNIGLFKIIEGMLKEGIEKGELRDDLDIELASLCIIGSISQFYGKRIFFDRKSCDDIYPEPMVDMILQGLK
jgi:AcrR family transcriptional regulator